MAADCSCSAGCWLLIGPMVSLEEQKVTCILVSKIFVLPTSYAREPLFMYTRDARYTPKNGFLGTKHHSDFSRGKKGK